MSDRETWDEFARREPHFAVLTDDQFLRARFDAAARERFFATGEADVAHLRSLIDARVGHGFPPRRVLDFGCGVGRLSLAWARVAEHVSGVDVSPQMCELARANARESGRENVTFTAHLETLAREPFDVVASLIVFQHIAVRDGLRLADTLLALVSPGGVAALHFTLRRPGGLLLRATRRLRAASPLLHRTVARFRGDRSPLPYMQVNEYPQDEIERLYLARLGSLPTLVPRADGDAIGAIFIGQRETTS